MTGIQLSVWLNFVAVATNVLGKNIVADWKETIDRLMFSLQAMGYPTVRSKMHLLFKHNDKYELYIGIFSDKHGERLHKKWKSLRSAPRNALTRKCLLNGYGR